jgi:hypothetical protein
MNNASHISKAYLGPPKGDCKYSEWFYNCMRSDAFFMSYELDGGELGCIICFSEKHTIDVTFEDVYGYLVSNGTEYSRLVENTWDRTNPRYGIFVVPSSAMYATS